MDLLNPHKATQDSRAIGARTTDDGRDWRSLEQVAEVQVSARLRDCVLTMQTQETRGRLYGILLNTSILKRLHVDAPNAAARLRESVGEIHEALAQVSALLDEMPGIDHAATGRLAREVHPQRVRELVELASRAVEPLAVLRGVSVQIEVASGAETLVCDRVRMVQVIAAMLANAVRRSALHGSVRVVVTRAEKSTLIAVIDRGAALTPETADDLLAPVTVADRTLPPLGMSLARQGVAQQGGTLRPRVDVRGEMAFEATFQDRAA